jgi:hypothetical protein
MSGKVSEKLRHRNRKIKRVKAFVSAIKISFKKSQGLNWLFLWAAKISNIKSIRSGFYFDGYLQSLNISFALLRIKLKEIWLNQSSNFSLVER